VAATALKIENRKTLICSYENGEEIWLARGSIDVGLETEQYHNDSILLGVFVE
jgi:hypothetical protein